ncbi:MAG: protein kinase [Rubripirellula sp.]
MDPPRNPIESIASEFAESIRDGQIDSIDEVVDSNPELESELRDLLPVIEKLEKARKTHVARPAGLASLGSSRPDRLGDFQIVRQIGRGGMGVVFEAMQESLGRKVALKVMPKSLLAGSDQLRRFQREAQMAGSLHHTNIVPVFGVGEDQGYHYFVMQRIEGHGLDRLSGDEDEKLTPNQVAHLGQQAAAALAYAHEQKVLHRDIKPANLIVNQELDLWVTDFGVAKAIESEAVTRTGDVVGTLRYMAPEQILGNSDVRSDIYSLGVTLYELLAGRPAMDDESIREALVARRPAPAPPRLRNLNSAVPRDLETILQTAMSIDPASRYQSANDLHDDLQRYLDGEPISVRPLSMFELGVRWAKRNPAVATLSALSFLLMAGVAIVSSIGFVKVQAALDGEQTSRQSAEATAELASGALNQIFDRFAEGSGDPGSSVEFGAAPALSDEAADLLEDLLHYYDAIAVRTNFGDQLQRSAVEARYAIGDIHFRLGHYSKAIDAFTASLAEVDLQATNSERKLRLVRLHNRIGLAHRMSGNDSDAQKHHQQSLDILATLQEETERSYVAFELAQTHYLSATRVVPGRSPDSMPPLLAASPPPRGPPGSRGRQRGGPPPRIESKLSAADQEHLETAISLLRELRKSDPENLGYALALAASLNSRQQDPDLSSTGSDADSLALLRELHERYPLNDRIRFQLSETLVGLNVFAEGAEGSSQQDLDRMQEAVSHLKLLADANPNVPKYANAVAHAHFKLAVLLERQSEFEPPGERREMEQQAGTSFRAAANRYKTLTRQHPDAIGYRAWYAVFLQSQAGNALRTDLLTQAERSFGRSIEQWKRLIKSHPEQQIAWHALPHAYEMLSRTLQRLGKHEESQAAIEQAELTRVFRDMDH